MRHHAQFDPYRRPKSFGSLFTGSVVNQLVLANVAVYLLQGLFDPTFTRLFWLSPSTVVTRFFFWQPFTYMFLHSSFMHLFFNMFILWIFGSPIEREWGAQRFLKYYLACGLGGAAFIMVFSYNGLPVIGASGAIFGLYLAYAMLYPNNYVYLYFLFPVKAKYLVTFIAVFQLVQGIAGPSGISYAAHLGGMATGLIFFRQRFADTRFWKRTQNRFGTYQNERREQYRSQESAKIDSILDKIAAKGYENLSATEKRILENYSRKQKEESE